MNTLRLHLLAHVQARHDYFADGLARAMSFEPTAECWQSVSAFEMVVRHNDHSLAVHVPEHRIPELWREAQVRPVLTLEFRVHSRDPAFCYYTEDIPNNPGRSDVDRTQSQMARIELADGVPTYAAWLAGFGQTQTLQWRRRHTIWRYWLLGDWDEKEISIVDTIQGGREFDALGPTAFDASQDRWALCFRSRAPLALCERPPGGLQLRAGPSPAASRVVVSQLPAARLSALQYEIGPNGRQAVSEIFVSR